MTPYASAPSLRARYAVAPKPMTRASASPPPSLTKPFATCASARRRGAPALGLAVLQRFDSAVRDDGALSPDGFAVDHVVQRFDVRRVESQLARPLHPIFQERAPPRHLQRGHVVRAFELRDEHDDAHPIGEQMHEVVI